MSVTGPAQTLDSAPDPAIEAAATSFCFMWAAMQMLDLFAFPDWVLEPTGIALFLVTVAVLLKRSSSGRFLALCALNLAYLYVRSPVTPNHILAEGFVGLAVCWTAFRNRRLRPAGSARAAVYREAAPVLRLILCIAYFFAFLHKLNWDFFSSETGCAGFMLEGLAERVPFLPSGAGMRTVATWGTLAVEGAIPVLLLFAPTRRSAMLMAWAFHFLLAFHPRAGIPGFSAMMLALLALFLSPSFFISLAESPQARRLQQVARRLRRRARVLLIAAVALAVVAAAGIYLGAVELSGAGLSAWPRLFGLGLWILYALACLAALLIARPSAAGRPVPLFQGALHTPVAALAALFFLNCMAPYLGFHTVRTMSMFSNLRTEGRRSNHLFLPASLQIAGYQDDLVEVVSSSDPWLNYKASERALVPYAEIRRVVWQRGPTPVGVVFRRNGTTYEVRPDDETVASWLPPLPFPLGKILVFRGVDPEGPARCRW